MILDITTEQALVLHERLGDFNVGTCMYSLFCEIHDSLKDDGIIDGSYDTEGLVIEGDYVLDVDLELMKELLGE